MFHDLKVATPPGRRLDSVISGNSTFNLPGLPGLHPARCHWRMEEMGTWRRGMNGLVEAVWVTPLRWESLQYSPP